MVPVYLASLVKIAVLANVGLLVKEGFLLIRIMREL